MKTVLAIAAHPDDIEFVMAGTLMLLKDEGFEIHYMNVADGCCGTTTYDTETITRIRRDEALAASEFVGAVFHESICNDLAIFYDRPTLAKVASVVRDVAPDILFTHSPDDYMEDHMNACRLALTAAFSRGMPNFPVDPQRPPVTNKVTVYHAQPYAHRDPFGHPVHPEIFVDVTSKIDRKVEMLAKHVSQKRWLDESQGLDFYLETLRQLDRQCGDRCGKFAYAEGWRRHLHAGFCDETDDPLCEVLQDNVFTTGSKA